MKLSIKFLLFFGLIVSMLSCSKQEESKIIQDEVFDTLISEAYEIFSKKSFDTFLDDELKELIAKPSLSKDELKRMENLSNAVLNNVLAQNVSFKKAYEAVLRLNLSQDQLRHSLEVSSIRVRDRFNENGIESRACWICNEKACANASILYIQGQTVLGFIGMLVHCG